MLNDELLDKMIDAACSVVPDLYRVDAGKIIEAALKVFVTDGEGLDIRADVAMNEALNSGDGSYKP